MKIGTIDFQELGKSNSIWVKELKKIGTSNRCADFCWQYLMYVLFVFIVCFGFVGI